jgi:hypothetical protein
MSDSSNATPEARRRLVESLRDSAIPDDLAHEV